MGPPGTEETRSPWLVPLALRQAQLPSRCLLCPVSVTDGAPPAGDHLHHRPAAPGHHPASTQASLPPFPASTLHQPKETLPRCAPEGKHGPGPQPCPPAWGGKSALPTRPLPSPPLLCSRLLPAPTTSQLTLAAHSGVSVSA